MKYVRPVTIPALSSTRVERETYRQMRIGRKILLTFWTRNYFF